MAKKCHGRKIKTYLKCHVCQRQNLPENNGRTESKEFIEVMKQIIEIYDLLGRLGILHLAMHKLTQQTGTAHYPQR